MIQIHAAHEERLQSIAIFCSVCIKKSGQFQAYHARHVAELARLAL